MTTNATKEPSRPRAKRLNGNQIFKQYSAPLSKIVSRAGKLTDTELKGVLEEPLKKLRQALWAIAERRDIEDAERADKGVVCWELFCPRTTKPMECSWTDRPRQITRTPNRIIDRNRYWTIKSEWRIETEDPWAQLDREWHKDRLTIEEQRRYWAEIDVLWERESRKRDFVITHMPSWAKPEERSYIETTEARCESEAQARERFFQWNGDARVILKIEVKE